MHKYAESKQKWARSEVGKVSSRAASKRWYEKNRAKVRIHRMVRYAVMVGNIPGSEVCEDCGSRDRVDAHHDDYSKAFEVRWLCRGCHIDWHQHNEAVPPADLPEFARDSFEHRSRKVSDAEVEEMKGYRDRGVSLRSLARDYDLSMTQVSRLTRGIRSSRDLPQ